MTDAAEAPKSRVERITARLRDNPVVAVIIVAAGVVAGIASFTDGATKIRALFHSDSPVTARTQLGQMGMPFTTDAFIAAAGNGDLQAVKFYVVAGMDPNSSAGDGSTALGSAALHGRSEVMTFLLDHGAVIWKIGIGQPALYWAIAGGHDDALRQLLDRKPDQATLDTTFVLATQRRQDSLYRHSEVLELLAAAGANVRAQQDAVMRAVWLNADDSYAAWTVDVLLTLGMQLSDFDNTFWKVGPPTKTPLMDAASQDFSRTAEVLLAHGAAVGTRFRHPGEDDDGATALMMASASGSAPIVRAMRAKGADPGAKDARGLTAFDYAKRGPPETMAAVMQALRAPS